MSVDNDPHLPPNVEFHEMSIRKVGGLYIGIATEFHAEPIWVVGKTGNWRDQAYTTLSLYVSRDGIQWQRASGSEPWVDNGRPGSYSGGFVSSSVAGQLVHNGKIYISHFTKSTKQSWHGRPQQPKYKNIPSNKA